MDDADETLLVLSHAFTTYKIHGNITYVALPDPDKGAEGDSEPPAPPPPVEPPPL